MAARSPCGRGWLVLDHPRPGDRRVAARALLVGSILINVFVVIVAVVAGAFLVPESKDPKATPLDPLGAVLSIAGLVALVYAIIEAPARLDRSGGGWRLHRGRCRVIGLPLVGGAHRASDAAAERFDNPRFSAASIAITLVFFAMFGTVFLNTQYLQFVLGYTPLEAGLRVMPVATMIVAAPPFISPNGSGPKSWWPRVSRSLPWHCPSWPPSPSTPDTGVSHWRSPSSARAWALRWRRRRIRSWGHCHWPRRALARP